MVFTVRDITASIEKGVYRSRTTCIYILLLRIRSRVPKEADKGSATQCFVSQG
jgi:hypothetical protein